MAASTANATITNAIGFCVAATIAATATIAGV